MSAVKCVNCEKIWKSDDDLPLIVEYKNGSAHVLVPGVVDEPGGEVFHGCDNCLSDAYLMEVDEETNIHLYACNIDWDIDEEDDDGSITLPQEIQIPDDIDQSDDDAISDWLSDEFGFCHKGFELIWKED